MVVFRLNNTVVSNPINWQDFGIRIFREDDINGLFIEFTTDLEFNGDGYRLIRDVFNNSLGCDLIDVEIIYYCDGVPRKLLDGYIIISECRFDLQRCIVKTKVFDNNYSSRINNNKSIEIDAYLTETKNGESLAPISTTDLIFFNPITGIYTSFRPPAIFIFDFFKQMVSFMSDSTLSLQSSVFDIGGEYRGLMCISGLTIRTREKNPIVTSFQKLFEAIHKKLNLSLYAKGNVLYIEKRDDVYLSGESIQIDNIRDLTQFIDKDKLSSAVIVGSEPVLQQWECNNGKGCANPQIRGFTFQEDQFGFKGTCNIDTVRDLKSSDIIFDTNVIEDVLIYNNQSYDKNVFIIDTEPSPNARRAVITNPFSTGTFFVYNGRLTNDKVINNYSNDLPNVIENYVSNPTPTDAINAQFIANRNLPNILFNIPATNNEYRYSSAFFGYLPFNDLILSSGNQYNPQLNINRFTALFPGIYTFQFRYFFRLISPGLGIDIDIRTIAVKKTGQDNQSSFLSGTVAQEKTITLESQILPTGIDLEQFGNFSIYMNTGETMQIDVGIKKFAIVNLDCEFLNLSPSFTGSPFFRCTSADLFQFTPPTINPENFNRIKYEFERPIDYSDVVSLMDNPEKIVRITHPKLPGGRNCFINEVVIQNLCKFETKFNLISNR
jgi:hypothetical protein